MSRFAAYFQQGDMESNGKRVSRGGEFIDDYTTGPIVWGEPVARTDSTSFTSSCTGDAPGLCDFLAPLETHHPIGKHHGRFACELLCADRSADARQDGRRSARRASSAERSARAGQRALGSQDVPGNRPTTSFVFTKLTPRTLGMLIAMYEHKIFVQGAVWDIFSFDQWGVELGKQLAKKIERSS